MADTVQNKGSILLVDDDRHLLESMSDWLRSLGYDVNVAATFNAAMDQISRCNFDLALVDVRMQDRDGFEILRHCRENYPNLTVMMITGYGTVETGVEALREGAFDLLTKPLIDQELEVAIERALSQREVVEENRQLKAQLDLRFSDDQIVGNDHRMQRVYEMITSVADTRATVLVTGESGTGKSLIARAIHRASARIVLSLIHI